MLVLLLKIKLNNKNKGIGITNAYYKGIAYAYSLLLFIYKLLCCKQLIINNYVIIMSTSKTMNVRIKQTTI